MPLHVRVGIIAALFAIALAQVVFGIANAQPQNPPSHCHIIKTCTLLPVPSPHCPPANQQTRPCQLASSPPVKICTEHKICGDP